MSRNRCRIRIDCDDLSLTTHGQRHSPRRIVSAVRFTKNPIDRTEERVLSFVIFWQSRLLNIIRSPRCFQLCGVGWRKMADDNHRNRLSVRIPFKGTQHFFSSDPRQQQVQQNQVGKAFPSQTNSFFAVASKEHEVACSQEKPASGQFLDFAVLHQK